MKDEEYCFVTDVRDKKVVARSARHQRTHAGKGGAVKLPSDYLTPKELKAMSGECKSYKLNSPMTWKEYQEMPDDIRILYIKGLRARYNVPTTEIGKMLGVCQRTILKEVARLGISTGHLGVKKAWHRDGWLVWLNGIPAPTVTTDPVEETQEEDTFPTINQAVEPEPEPVDLVQPVPVFTIPLKAKSTLDRALGMLLGLSYGATPDIGRGILDAMELIECALGEGECE